MFLGGSMRGVGAHKREMGESQRQLVTKTAVLHPCSGEHPICLQCMPPVRKAQLLSSLRRHEFGLTSDHGTAGVDRAVLLLLLVGDVWPVKSGLRH